MATQLTEKTRMNLPVEKWVALTLGVVGLYTGFMTALSTAVAKETEQRIAVLKSYPTREELQERLFSIERQLIQIKNDQRLLLLEVKRRR